MARASRRWFLRLAAASVAGTLAACVPRPSPTPASTGVITPVRSREPSGALNTGETTARLGVRGQGPTVAITPTQDFYTVAITKKTDWLDPSTYSLSVDGLVRQPYRLTLADIQRLPAVSTMRTLECISNPPGGNLISTAMWTGVRLRDILGMAGITGGLELKILSADGYRTSIPLSLALDEDSLLAYEMNGEPLPPKHGAPLRCLFPGRYGMKQPKWVTHLEVIDGHYLGHWEEQGWSNEAIIKINSQIATPAEGEEISQGVYIISGTAFADESGVARLEVSTDGGTTWHEAKLVHGPSPLVWTEWSYLWAVPISGEERAIILARATDGHGNVQTAKGRKLLPDDILDGTSAMHSVSVLVRRGP